MNNSEKNLAISFSQPFGILPPSFLGGASSKLLLFNFFKLTTIGSPLTLILDNLEFIKFKTRAFLKFRFLANLLNFKDFRAFDSFFNFILIVCFVSSLLWLERFCLFI